MSRPDKKADELKAAIAALEAQRSSLGDSVVDPAVAALRRQLEGLAAPAPPSFSEERKLVTIVFVDVSGFTALAEKLDAEEVRSLINACFDDLVPIVQKYGGTIDKFIGDEIMALFGAPLAHENDPERALRSALEMMEKISSFNEKHGTSLGLHIGVNTGPVVTGAIGSQGRQDYSVMGDAVNLAARLEQASDDGEIYVGPNTQRLTANMFDFEAMPALELKGKSKPVLIHRLIGLKAAPKPARGIEGLRCEMIARGREMEKMDQAIRALRTGSGGIVVVIGEAGVGKSRLVAEALNLASDLGRAEGRALSHTTGMNYWMARDVLRNLLGIRPEMDPAQSDALLRGSIEGAFPADGTSVYPYLACLLELPLSPEADEQVKFLTNEALHGRILRAFRDYVAARAQRERLVLFWEDLHWCDPTSLLILEKLLPLPKEEPLLLLLAYRPDDAAVMQWRNQARFPNGSHCLTIELSPLTRDQSRDLIRRLLKIENLPERMREAILDRAEGNPFFVEELLRSLLESGAIRIERDGCVATANLEALNVPDTIQGVLMTRVDRLPPPNKELLQNAAILGRVFPEKWLAQLVNGNEPARAQLSESLAELQARDFIHIHPPSAAGEREYTFKHAITHDVVYDSLLLSRRKELHRRAGIALETLFPTRREELAATLGYHFQKGEAHEQALHYLTRAAERARDGFANLEAIDFYRSAISEIRALLGQAETQETSVSPIAAQLYEELGDLLELVGQHDAARQAYGSGFLFLSPADRAARSRFHRKIGFSHSIQRRFADTSEAFDKAEAELGPEEAETGTGWWTEKVEVLLERLHLLYWQGMAAEMTILAQQRRSLVESKGTPIQRGAFFTQLALTELSRGRYVPSEKALDFAKLAVEAAEGAPDLKRLAHIQFVRGFANLWCGNLRDASAQLRLTLEIAEKIGDVVTQTRCLTYMAVAHRRLIDLEETERIASIALKLAAEVAMPEYIAMAKANLCWVAWRKGDAAEARKLGTEALDHWHGMADPYGFDWMALLPLIAMAGTENRLAEAIEHTKGLFGENQHPLPESLVLAAQKLINAAKEESAARTKPKLDQLVEVAKQIGYL